MVRAGKAAFDAQVFLANVGAGKTILEFQKNQIVFAQGDVADAVFYVQKGKVKVTVLSDQGKEAVVGILGPGQFFGEACMNGHKLRISLRRFAQHYIFGKEFCGRFQRSLNASRVTRLPAPRRPW